MRSSFTQGFEKTAFASGDELEKIALLGALGNAVGSVAKPVGSAAGWVGKKAVQAQGGLLSAAGNVFGVGMDFLSASNKMSLARGGAGMVG